TPRPPRRKLRMRCLVSRLGHEALPALLLRGRRRRTALMRLGARPGAPWARLHLRGPIPGPGKKAKPGRLRGGASPRPSAVRPGARPGPNYFALAAWGLPCPSSGLVTSPGVPLRLSPLRDQLPDAAHLLVGQGGRERLPGRHGVAPLGQVRARLQPPGQL